MKKMNGISGRTAKSLLGVVALMALLVAVAGSSRGQEQISKRGIVTPLASANLVFDANPRVSKLRVRTAIQTKVRQLSFSKLLPGAWFPPTITPLKNN
jgi:hypothetical protein